MEANHGRKIYKHPPPPQHDKASVVICHLLGYTYKVSSKKLLKPDLAQNLDPDGRELSTYCQHFQNIQFSHSGDQKSSSISSFIKYNLRL